MIRFYSRLMTESFGRGVTLAGLERLTLVRSVQQVPGYFVIDCLFAIPKLQNFKNRWAIAQHALSQGIGPCR